MREAASTSPREAGQESGLRERLRECVATRELCDGELTPIEGGLSNLAWRLDAHGDSWFVRLGHPGAARLGVDRRSECVVLQAVGAAGLAPDVRACSPDNGLLVTRFVAGHAWRPVDVATEANLVRFAGLLRRLHELPVPDGVCTVDYAQQAWHLAAGLPAADATAAALQSPAAAAFARLAARGFVHSLCHHDLHHLNVLDDGARLWLVDWEYGGRGDPLLDVAGFLAMHELPPGLTALFLEAYGRLPAADIDCLDDARWAFDYVQWLWYRSRFPGPADDPAGHADRLALRLLHCNN
jgi:thiamine kinase-like enzyme